MQSKMSRRIVLTLFWLLIPSTWTEDTHNVCKTYIGYSTKMDCYFNPDVDSYTDKIIANHGYPVETYEVVTKDGYILALYRIPNNSTSSQTIYIQHGANTDSTVWVDIGERSLAFYLSELGYDVWMGNIRGSYYSRGHVEKISPLEYWDFNLDDLAWYDIPALIQTVYDNINHKDNKKMIYIGHSMGTTLSYLYSIINPDVAEARVCGFINFAPVTYFDHTIVGNPAIAPAVQLLQEFLQRVTFAYTPDRDENQRLFRELCWGSAARMEMCNGALEIGFGRNVPQRKPDDVPIILSYVDSGISSKILGQFLQFRHGKFNRFDYKERNIIEYNQITPPEYNISVINNRYLLLYGPRDTLSKIEDINAFRGKLRDPGLFEVIKVENFNHLDFMYAKDIISLLYETMMPFINRQSANSCR